MKKENCIFTCFNPVGAYSIKSFQIHLNNVKRYCKKFGIDLFVLDYEVQKYNVIVKGQEYYKHTYYRFYIYELLKEYNRVLYIDFDMLFLEGCQNVFELIPKDKIGYVPMMNLEDQDINRPIVNSNCNLYNKIYNTNVQSLHVSGGFHLIPDTYQQWMNLQKLQLKRATALSPGRLFDTEYMRYITSRFANDTYQLPIEYNFLYPHKLFPDVEKFENFRNYAQSGKIKIIHIVALSPQNLSRIRYEHMLYFDNKFGIKLS